jgi:hypothetical protein
MDVSLTTAIFIHPEIAKKEWLGAAGPPKFSYHIIGLHYATPQKTVSSRHVHVSTYNWIAIIIILLIVLKKREYCCNMSAI